MQLEEIQTCPRRVIHLQETQNFGEPKLVVASGPSLGVLTEQLLLLDNYTPEV